MTSSSLPCQATASYDSLFPEVSQLILFSQYFQSSGQQLYSTALDIDMDMDSLAGTLIQVRS